MGSLELVKSRLEQVRPLVTIAARGDAVGILDRELHHVAYAELARFGITYVGTDSTNVFVTNLEKSVGAIRVEARGRNSTIIIDTDHRGGRINGNLRVAADGCMCLMSTPDYGLATLNIVAFRSDDQLFYWGRGSTSVGLSVEIEGVGRSVLVGDDALVSSGVWIRNHDMHSLVDLDKNTVTNGDAVDTVVEPHVWIGQDTLLLRCQRVGFGSVLAAKALVRGSIPPKSIIGGVPGRVLRDNASWGREISGMSAREYQLIADLSNR